MSECRCYFSIAIKISVNIGKVGIMERHIKLNYVFIENYNEIAYLKWVTLNINYFTETDILNVMVFPVMLFVDLCVCDITKFDSVIILPISG